MATPVSVDGYYAPGTIVTLNAVASSGYGLKGLSGDPLDYRSTITMNSDHFVTANFGIPVAVFTGGTAPITVDGVTYSTQGKAFAWDFGSTHTVSVPSSYDVPPNLRYSFVSWSDNGALTHQVTVPTTPGQVSLGATFHTLFHTTLSVSPPEAGKLVTSPALADNYFPAGTSFQVTAVPNPGFLFTGFSPTVPASTPTETVASSYGSAFLTGYFLPLNQIASPAAGSTLTSNSTFRLQSVLYFPKFRLDLGSTPGGQDLFSRETNAPTVVVSGLQRMEEPCMRVCTRSTTGHIRRRPRLPSRRLPPRPPRCVLFL